MVGYRLVSGWARGIRTSRPMIGVEISEEIQREMHGVWEWRAKGEVNVEWDVESELRLFSRGA